MGDRFSVAFRMTVKAVISDSGAGRFSLRASQIAPFNIFMPIERLQRRLELPARANMLLIGGDSALNLATADSALKKNWKLADADLELRKLPDQGVFEIRTNRIFLDAPAADAAVKATPESIKILTYFVNEIRLGERTTPYSIISAIEPAIHNLHDDEILINAWLADDLQASVGDVIQLAYFVFGDMRKLEEREGSFRVHAILPMEGAAADPELMPAFPGLSNIENCRDWKPGIPIALDKIRKKDEEYWDRYRGTPKAFITLEAGQRRRADRCEIPVFPDGGCGKPAISD